VGSSSGDDGVPDSYIYRLDLVVTDYIATTSSAGGEKEGTTAPRNNNNNNNKQTLSIAGVNAASTAVTLSKLLQWLMNNSSSSSSRSGVDVTVKAFATQPRQPLPPFLLLDDDPVGFRTSSGGGIRALRYHFLALPAVGGKDDATTHNDVSASCSSPSNSSSRIPEIEFRQCTVEDWSALPLPRSIVAPKKLIISCTLPEFVKFGAAAAAPQLLLLAHGVQELSLLLHFWLQGPPLQAFCQNIILKQQQQQLQTLSLQYLDISDGGWVQLMESLHQHPTLHTLHLQFTDNFVDTYRRLTPERRVARSRAVLELVQANPRIRHVAFPSFQQDADCMAQVQQLLQARREDEEHPPHGIMRSRARIK